jgi:glutamine synthetase
MLKNSAEENIFVIEYVWIGGTNEFRSKTRIINLDSKKRTNFLYLSDIPDWNYDGSSTKQATGIDSDIIIKPKALFKNPFGPPYDYIVLCDTYLPDDSVVYNNTRVEANKLFNRKLEEKPWFGLEQEYFLIDLKTGKPIGFDPQKKQGQYYCSVGSENSFGRKIAEEHLTKCLLAGIKISGINAEVAPGQWEFQVGPCIGIEAGDHLMMARYILERVGEKNNIKIDINAKPLKGNWNGSGCHTNYSTKNMREGTEQKTGLEYINEAIHKLSLK